MSQKLPIGYSLFEDVISNDLFYVDKSLLIKEFWEEDSQVVLIPRPRRFGKTLNISMIWNFFDRILKGQRDTGVLFNALKIAEHSDVMAHQGQYPVIHLSFRSVEEENWQNALESIKQVITKEFRRHAAVTETLSQYEKISFDEVATRTGSLVLYTDAILTLAQHLHEHYGEKVIVLMDEYDKPLETARRYGYYDEANAFFRALLVTGLKDNPHLSRGLLTGVMRVAGDSIFSTFNNVDTFSILRDRFADKFGLTQQEVLETLERFSLSDQQNLVEQWYNGYLFGEQKIYNPWSIIKFLKEGKTDPYWVNTSENAIVRDVMLGHDMNISDDQKILMEGGCITIHINENLSYQNIQRGRDTFWNFLTFMGYATVREKVGEGSLYRIALPNLEVRLFYKETLTSWLNSCAPPENVQTIVTALEKNDLATFERSLQDLVKAVLSTFDTDKREVERAYHMFILGVLCNAESYFTVKSNGESGYGRYDAALIPKQPNRMAYVLEFKLVKQSGAVEKAFDAAFQQIDDRDYAHTLRAEGYDDITAIAIACKGKRVWVQSKML